jgi:chromosome segregation ATPase
MKADLAASRKIEKQLRAQIKALHNTLEASKQSERHAKQRCTSMMDALRRVQSEKRAASDGVEAAQNRATVQQRSIASLQSRVVGLEAALSKVIFWAPRRTCLAWAQSMIASVVYA